MEERAVVRFVILKRLNPEDIHTGLLSVDGRKKLALLTV
jgi:hypothetical protein